MKTYHALITTVCLAAWLHSAAAQTDPNPDNDNTPAPAAASADPEREGQSRPDNDSPAPPESEGNLRLNFRGVPLETVLDYLSEAVGFIIVLETEVEGTVDVWSNQPLTPEEALNLLNTVLNQHGYAALRNGRTLRIVNRDEARQRDIPVQTGNNPDNIPKTDEMVTQIIPIRYADATQMTQDLQPLLPSYATLTANESGNALVLTDTQSNVRRIVEIVKALDTSISSISTVRVFPLRHADATTLATSVQTLFESPEDQDDRNNRRRGFRGRGGGDDNQASGDSEARRAASRVVAVADERSNSLVVSAPEEFIPTIEQLVEEIDVSVSDITELQVFPLKNADPVEMADILAGLFPDESGSEEDQNGGFRFGPRGFRDRDRNNEPETSERIRKQSRVIAMPDPRTSSLIVSAPSALMPQIEEMIAQLDSSSAKNQKVFVYSLENADVLQVEQILRQMFERTNVQGNRNTQNQTSPLSNRRQSNQQTGGASTDNGNFRPGTTGGTTGR